MIKSKFHTYQSIGRFIMTALVIFLCGLFYPIYCGKNPTPIFSGTGLISMLLTVILPIIIIAQMIIVYKTVIINTNNSIIAFKIFMLPIAKAYAFEYFDGYVDTITKDKYGSYQCFYLVKDSKLKYKISEKYYSNIDELKEGLSSSFKYMGFIKYTTSLSIKIALHENAIDI